MATLMNIIAAIVGYAFILLILALCLWACLLGMQRISDRWREHVTSAATRALGLRIYRDAAWFDANPDAQAVLQTLGISLNHNATYDPERLRAAFEKGEVPE
jgi:hypothetical protein